MAEILSPRMHSDATRILLEAVENADIAPYQAKIAQRIQDLEDEILALKGCHNAVTPTCRLPPKVLTNIFLIVSAMSRSWGLGITKPMLWFPITQICRHWRSIALECTNLWTDLQFVNPAFTEYMLGRSRTAPLTVKFSVRGSTKIRELEPVLSRALCQLDRLQVVGIYLPYNAGVDLLPGFATIAHWNGSAPILEKLVLRVNERKKSVSLPSDFLQGGAPLLHTLNIKSCGISWGQAPLGSRLTQLTLQEDGRGDSHRASVDVFLASLREMPLLHTMKLEGFAPRLPDPAYTIPDMPLPMPYLTVLDLEDLPDHISLIFHILRFRDFKQVNITFDHIAITSPRFASSFRQALGDIKQSYGRDSDIHKGIRRIHMSGTSRYELCFDPHETKDSFYSTSFSIEGRNCILPIAEHLAIIDTHFNLSTTAFLNMSMFPDPPFWTREVWTMLSRLPKLNGIIIEGALSAVPAFLNWWKEELGSPSDANSCFPSLATLCFQDVRIHPQLIEILQNRSSSSHPLSELYIRNCEGLNRADCARLRQAAPGLTLVWDQEDQQTEDKVGGSEESLDED